MSVLVEKIAKNGISGEIENGNYPPGAMKNVSFTRTIDTIQVSATQPENTIINGLTLSVFSYVVCVLKRGSIPSGINDGKSVTVNSSEFINKSCTILYDNLSEQTKYYIRFFTFSTNDECNNSAEMIYECSTTKPLSPTLGDNDWETVIRIAEAGNAQDYWNIGDEIELTLSGKYNITCTMQIWGFNHFSNPRFGGNTYNDNICFGCKDIYIREKLSSTSTVSGWDYTDSYICKTVLPNIYNSLPSVVKNSIKQIGSLEFRTANKQYGYVHNQTVFIPTMDLTGTNFEGVTNNYDTFPIFTDNTSRIKNYNGTACEWWLMDGYRGSIKLAKIEESGILYFPQSDMPISSMAGVVFCFCI